MIEHNKEEPIHQKETNPLVILNLRSSTDLEEVDILSPSNTEDTIIDD